MFEVSQAALHIWKIFQRDLGEGFGIFCEIEVTPCHEGSHSGAGVRPAAVVHSDAAPDTEVVFIPVQSDYLPPVGKIFEPIGQPSNPQEGRILIHNRLHCHYDFLFIPPCGVWTPPLGSIIQPSDFLGPQPVLSLFDVVKPGRGFIRVEDLRSSVGVVDQLCTVDVPQLEPICNIHPQPSDHVRLPVPVKACLEVPLGLAIPCFLFTLDHLFIGIL